MQAQSSRLASRCRPPLLAATTRGSVGTCWEFLTTDFLGGEDVAGLTPLRFGQPKTEETVKTLVPSSPCRKQTAYS